MPAPETPLPFSFRIKEGFPIVALTGEIDISIGEQFRRFLADSIPENAPLVLFDFSGVEYFDSTALGILCAYPKPSRGKLLFAPSRYALTFFQSIYFKNPMPFLFANDEDSAIELARSQGQGAGTSDNSM